MSKRKLRIKLSPQDKQDYQQILDATRNASQDVAEKILTQFLMDVAARSQEDDKKNPEPKRDKNFVTQEYLETQARKAAKSRLDAKHETEGIGPGLNTILGSQNIEPTTHSITIELEQRRKSEPIQQALNQFADVIHAPIHAGGRFVIRLGKELLETAQDGGSR